MQAVAVADLYSPANRVALVNLEAAAVLRVPVVLLT
jgi:hypothetical protein